LIKTLLSGSLAKGTALKTLNDIDIAFYVKGEKVPSKERELLEWLAQRVREAYPQMKADQIKVNRHSICISYAVSGLNVDIVPVQYCGDPDDRGYLFPFDGGEPVLTSIPLHLQFIRIRKPPSLPHNQRRRQRRRRNPHWSNPPRRRKQPLRRRSQPNPQREPAHRLPRLFQKGEPCSSSPTNLRLPSGSKPSVAGILLLLVTYGLRAHEVARLTLDDVDWKHERLQVLERKAGQPRIVPGDMGV
jgi:hypothetical protein